MTTYEKLTLLITALGVLVGIGVLIVYIYQLRAMRGQLTAMKNQLTEMQKGSGQTREALILTHRPKLIVRNVVVNELPLFSKDHLIDRFTGSYDVANVGSTAARIVSVNGGIYMAGGLPMKRPYDDGIPGREDDTRLAAGESRTISLRQQTDLPAAAMIAYLSGEVEAWIVGLLIYRDELGIQRQTGICRRFDPVSKRFVHMEKPDADYEYAD
jgi:hypothetical protein